MPRKINALTADVIRKARAVVETSLGTGDLNASIFELSYALVALDTAELPDPDAGHGRWVEGSPETSRHAALTIPQGSRREIVMQVAAASRAQVGLTDEELERRLKKKHTTVSAARNHLVGVGWLQDSGKRRKGSSQRPAVVWELTEAGHRTLTGGA